MWQSGWLSEIRYTHTSRFFFRIVDDFVKYVLLITHIFLWNPIIEKIRTSLWYWPVTEISKILYAASEHFYERSGYMMIANKKKYFISSECNWLKISSYLKIFSVLLDCQAFKPLSFSICRESNGSIWTVPLLHSTEKKTWT